MCPLCYKLKSIIIVVAFEENRVLRTLAFGVRFALEEQITTEKVSNMCAWPMENNAASNKERIMENYICSSQIGLRLANLKYTQRKHQTCVLAS